jgi:hypothetical protein
MCDAYIRVQTPLRGSPAPGTENDDHNPQRIQSRTLFDLAVGDDNLFGGDKHKWSLRFTALVLNVAAIGMHFANFWARR